MKTLMQCDGKMDDLFDYNSSFKLKKENVVNISCGGGGARILHPSNSYGHKEMGPRFKVSSEKLEQP